MEANGKRMCLIRLFPLLALMISGYYCPFLDKQILVFVHAHDNGLALTPPLGWRSWNLYGGNIHQSQMINIMDGMVRRNRVDHLGNIISLSDLGYSNVGLDDVWQDCHSPYAAEGMHYHDKYGNPLVDTTRFPSMTNMTRYANNLNLTAGWYANNCACSDHCRNQTECDRQIRQDVKALLRYGFSSLKVDGCGNEIDLHVWNKYIEQYTTSNFTTNTTRRKILVENCHGPDPKFKPNRTLPPSEGCPYHFYRTSTDIRNNYPSIMHNLGTIESYRKSNSSYPGCWAYADMLQVGVRDGLSLAETRSHFGGWSIVSSPLILSHDVNDDSIMDKIWDIISNREVLEINQAYFGDSGGTYNVANETIVLQHDKYKSEVPVYQYLSKPIGLNVVAVLLMNSDDTERMLRTSFDDIPGLADGTSSVHDNGNDNNNDNNDDEYYLVRDMWNHRDMGAFQSSVTMSVGSHDAVFLLIEKRKGTVSAIAKDAVSNSLMVLMN